MVENPMDIEGKPLGKVLLCISKASIANKIKELATDIGIEKIAVVGNKIRGPEDEEYLKKNLADYKFLGFLPYSEKVIKADQENRPPDEIAPELKGIVKGFIEEKLKA